MAKNNNNSNNAPAIRPIHVFQLMWEAYESAKGDLPGIPGEVEYEDAATRLEGKLENVVTDFVTGGRKTLLSAYRDVSGWNKVSAENVTLPEITIPLKQANALANLCKVGEKQYAPYRSDEGYLSAFIYSMAVRGLVKKGKTTKGKGEKAAPFDLA